jgi:hypothetical protein
MGAFQSTGVRRSADLEPIIVPVRFPCPNFSDGPFSVFPSFRLFRLMAPFPSQISVMAPFPSPFSVLAPFPSPASLEVVPRSLLESLSSMPGQQTKRGFLTAVLASGLNIEKWLSEHGFAVTRAKEYDKDGRRGTLYDLAHWDVKRGHH